MNQDTQVFRTPEERDRWQIQQYGFVRNGYRTDYDRTDERPLLIDPWPFWKDASEEERFIRAVRSCPTTQYGHLDLFDYLREVSSLAEGIKPQPVKAMADV